MAFTAIPNSDIDPESPLTTGLMTNYRDNDDTLKAWIGGSFTPNTDHDHDGVNSKLLPGNIYGNLYAFYNYR